MCCSPMMVQDQCSSHGNVLVLAISKFVFVFYSVACMFQFLFLQMYSRGFGATWLTLAFAAGTRGSC